MQMTATVSDRFPVLRQGIQAILEDLSVSTVAEAESGDFAWRDICRFMPDLAIASSDLKKTCMHDFAEKLKSRGTKTRLLIIMKNDDKASAKALIECGAHGIISYDSSRMVFSNAIETVLRNEIYVCPKLSGASSKDNLSKLADINPYNLTEREIAVLKLVAQGASNKGIAFELNISIRTVESHRYHMRLKTGVRKTSEMAFVALKMGLVEL